MATEESSQMTARERRVPSLRREWTLAFAIMVLTSVLVGIGTFVGTRQLVDKFSAPARQLEQQTALVESIRTNLQDHEATSHQLLRGTPEDKKAYLAEQNKISGQFAEALRIFPANNGTRPVLQKTLDAWQISMISVGLWGNQIQTFTPLPVNDPDGVQVTFAASSDDARAELDGLQAPSLKTMHQALIDAKEFQDLMMVGLSVLVLLDIGVTLYFRRRMVMNLLRPVAAIHDGVVKLEAGELNHRVEVTRLDELGELTEAFNSMAKALSERQELEAQLRLAHKLESVGRLAAGIAHEINTPVQFVGDNLRFLENAFNTLGGLIGTYQNLLDNNAEGSRLRHEAEEAVDFKFFSSEIPMAIDQSIGGVSRVATLVRAMKAFSYPDQTEQLPVDLNEAIANTLVVAGSEITPVADIDTDFGELVPLICYPGEVNQVLLNVFVNAAHAISEKHDDNQRGRITVRTRLDGADIVVSIADTGRGIPSDIAEHIFDQFFTTKEVGHGTGQGLALARVAMDRHQGTITFDSKPGVGTTFTLRFPVGGRAAGQITDNRLATTAV